MNPPNSNFFLFRKQNGGAPNVLVLGPGAEKGFLHLGSLIYLEKAGFLDSVDTICGCSVGALIGVLLSIGYSVNDIINIAYHFELIKDISQINPMEMFNKMGLIDISVIEEKLNFLIIQKLGYLPTLKSLKDKLGIRFESIGCDSTHGKCLHLTAENYPNLTISQAAVMSCVIPFFFHQYIYENCVIIDGAMINPYPIDLYDNGKNIILGIWITDQRPNYITQITRCSIERLRELNIQKSSSRCYHLVLNCPSILDEKGTSSDFKGFKWIKSIINLAENIMVSPRDKKIMLFSGYDQTRKIINSNHSSSLPTPISDYSSSIPTPSSDYSSSLPTPISDYSSSIHDPTSNSSIHESMFNHDIETSEFEPEDMDLDLDHFYQEVMTNRGQISDNETLPPLPVFPENSGNSGPVFPENSGNAVPVILESEDERKKYRKGEKKREKKPLGLRRKGRFGVEPKSTKYEVGERDQNSGSNLELETEALKDKDMKQKLILQWQELLKTRE